MLLNQVVLGIVGVWELVLLSLPVMILMLLIPIFVSKGKKNRLPIVILTILLGWTFIGWVGALIWAIMSPKEIIHHCQKCGFKKGFEVPLKIFKCPQCGEENQV